MWMHPRIQFLWGYFVSKDNQQTVKSQNGIHWNPDISKYQATEKKGYLL